MKEEELLKEYLTGINKLSTKALALLGEDTPTVADGTSFADIELEYKEFDLFNVDVHKVFDKKTGKRGDGNEWTKQSLIIKDQAGQERELIAWGDHIATFDTIRIGDRLDILCVAKVTEYKDKMQFTIGHNTSIEQVKDKEQVVL